MKINIVVPFKRLSGGIKVIFTYANLLWERGHDVAVYMPVVSYKTTGQTLPRQIKASISNALKPEHWIDRKFRFVKVPLIRQRYIRDADVVIATSWPTAYDVDRLPPSKGKKVYFVQGYEIFSGDASEVDPTYQLGMHTIAITGQLARLLEDKFQIQAQVVYNGLAEEEFLPTEKPASAPSVMLLYHEEAYKGTQTALDVVRRLQAVHPNLQINIFGRKVGKDIPDSATVLEDPSREKLMQMYRSSHIYLFTSTQEAWGLPILEAMANKCAVVGYRVGALTEIAHEDNAVVLEPGDADGLFAAANTLLQDPARLAAIQERAYNTALQFSWEKSCDAFVRELEKLVNGQ